MATAPDPIKVETPDKGSIYYTTDGVMTPADREWLCEMAMNGVRVYVNHPERVDLWVSASNPDPSIVELIKNTTKIVVLASGLPPNPPKDPPH